MNKDFIQYLRCPTCHKEISFSDNFFVCSNNHQFQIVSGIPQLLPQNPNSDFESTSNLYGKLWKETKSMPISWHIHEMQKVLPQNIAQGKLGLEIGCGSGFDSVFIAQENPSLQLCSIDISEGVFVAQKNLERKGLKNLNLVRASATSLPFQDATFDFCYSFGVLHHLREPYDGFKEVIRVLKPGAPFYLYLYEDHHDDPLKFYPLKFIKTLRKLTSKLSPTHLKIVATCLSPFVVVSFSWPSKILGQFKKTEHIAKKIPFNFGKGLFSVTGDLYDRFGAPYEHRFNQTQLKDWYKKQACEKYLFTKLQKSSGLVTMGFKS